MTTRRAIYVVVLAVMVAALLSLSSMKAQMGGDPWTTQQTVQAADLAKELSSGKAAPTVLFVGYQRLYGAGHIKGAEFHGSGGSAEGLAEIKKWGEPQSRKTNLVIYCGCCPMERCPNVGPPFLALREMGFTKMRVLILPTSFAVDWADKGLPYER